jgi:hypothetical protein
MLQQVLSRISGKPVKERLNERCLAFAREHGLPAALIETLDACAYAGPIRIGPVSLSRLAELDLENSDEENAACLRNGFLIVGSGLNGDPVALELVSGRMAFISHDLLWERMYEDFEECVVRTPLTFDDFWLNASQVRDFPRDSYDAEKRWPSKLGGGGETG